MIQLVLVCIVFLAESPSLLSEATVIFGGNRIPVGEWDIPRWKHITGWEALNYGPYFGQPEQIHLSYGGDVSKIYVTWLTFDSTETSEVQYGTVYGKFDQKVASKIDYFKDGGKKGSIRYTHRALIENVQPGVRYFYRVGSEYGWSAILSFVGLKERPDGGYTFAVFGDMGNINARSLGLLQELAQGGDIDMVLHNGDMAYNLHSLNGTVGDKFMRQIEPVAAYVPYMTTVGNHENRHNFSHYINRFTMPNTKTNLFYSFDIGKAHIVAFSTEFHFDPQNFSQPLHDQWNFLIADLKKANKNRKNVPWIITLGHRPMYCSTWDPREDCRSYDSIVRTGLNGTHEFGLEKLFYKYGVDLEFWAHEHNYERLFPIYNRTVYNGSRVEPYVNPPAPVHVVTGSAGCQEFIDPFVRWPGPWSAFRSINYGIGRMHVVNATHLKFEQVVATGEVEDSIWIVKDAHHPYTISDLHRLKKYGTYIPEDYCHHPSHCDGQKKPKTSDL